MDYLKNYLMMQHQYFIQTKPGNTGSAYSQTNSQNGAGNKRIG